MPNSAPVACEPIAPSQLPSGAEPVEQDESVDADGRTVVWGTGSDEDDYDRRRYKRGFKSDVVGQRIGINNTAEWEDQLPDDDPQRVQVRGDEAIVIPVGDPPLGQIMIGWTAGACDYTMWVGPGLTLEEALSYAESL